MLSISAKNVLTLRNLLYPLGVDECTARFDSKFSGSNCSLKPDLHANILRIQAVMLNRSFLAGPQGFPHRSYRLQGELAVACGCDALGAKVTGYALDAADRAEPIRAGESRECHPVGVRGYS